MKCGSTTLGLIQGMFEKNILTFIPGVDSERDKLSSFVETRQFLPARNVEHCQLPLFSRR